MKLVKLCKRKGFISRDNLIQPNETYYPMWLYEVQKWLRETHNIVVEINFNDGLFRRLHEVAHKKKSLDYHWVMFTNTNDTEFMYEKFYSDDTFTTYEQALEQGLERGLKLIR